ncbi:hypothetical protein ACFYZB_12325 [Streptomyces sp. NPDC001852]|uniref:hypothetical protein n=1 Tax=unclassified Streptomyces TaxID=2593676 RepID=UPI00331F5E51
MANCVTTQRPARVSQRTTASPSLVDWQEPPNPDQSVLVSVGARTVAPDLEYTA